MTSSVGPAEMAIIILKIESNPYTASWLLQSRSIFLRYGRHARHNKYSETIRRLPGSTNTVGQALAQLSPGTSDTAALRDYDDCRGFLTRNSLRLRWRVWGTKFVSRRKSKNTRFSLTVICFA